MANLSIIPHSVSHAFPAAGDHDSPVLDTALLKRGLVINRLVAMLNWKDFKKYLLKKSKQKQGKLRNCKMKGKHKRAFFSLKWMALSRCWVGLYS